MQGRLRLNPPTLLRNSAFPWFSRELPSIRHGRTIKYGELVLTRLDAYCWYFITENTDHILRLLKFGSHFQERFAYVLWKNFLPSREERSNILLIYNNKGSTWDIYARGLIELFGGGGVSDLLKYIQNNPIHQASSHYWMQGIWHGPLSSCLLSYSLLRSDDQTPCLNVP